MIETPPNMTPNASPMHTAHNTQLNQSNNAAHSIPNRPPPPRPAPANPNSGAYNGERKTHISIQELKQFSSFLQILQPIEMFRHHGL